MKGEVKVVKIKYLKCKKAEKLTLSFSEMDYTLGKVVVHRENEKTIALRTHIAECPEIMKTAKLFLSTKKQDLYVFFADNEGINGRLFFYSYKRVNQLKELCNKEVVKIESNVGFLQENQRMLDCHKALTQALVDLREVRANSRSHQYREAYLYLLDSMRQYDKLIHLTQGQPKVLSKELHNEFQTIGRALENLIS